MPTACLRGLTRYTFLDENNQRTFALDQYGNRVWGGHWNANLITNTGLNAVATERLMVYVDMSSTPQEFRAHLRIGTGSTAPAYTNSSLANELLEGELGEEEPLPGNSNGGFGDSNAFPDPSGGTIEAHLRVTRVITMVNARNLTEYGFSREALTSLNIRELFRDESDNPITISLGAGKKIRVDHTLIVSLPWGASAHTLSIQEYDISNALVATHSISVNGVFVAASTAVRGRMFRTALPPQGVADNRKVIGRYLETPSSEPDVAATPSNEVFVESVAYTPGSHALEHYVTYTEAQVNGLSYGYVLKQFTEPGGSGNAALYGYRVAFQAPLTFEKLDTHTLRFAVVLSWARA